MQCMNCGCDTDNPKFCDRSCAASFSNRNSPKRIAKVWKCETCSCVVGKRQRFCEPCRSQRTNVDMTIAEAIYKNHHRSSAYSLIRNRARISTKDRDQCCEHCGYDKHVEAAHIVAISDFSDDTLVSVVNDPSNIKLLCPNCHWEFDNLPR